MGITEKKIQSSVKFGSVIILCVMVTMVRASTHLEPPPLPETHNTLNRGKRLEMMLASSESFYDQSQPPTRNQCKAFSENLCKNPLSANGPAEMQCEFFSPNSGVNFLMWILGGEFLGGEFLRGLFLLENIGPTKMTPEFGPKIRGSKIRIPEFGVEFGFMRCKIPSAETCPWPFKQSCRRTFQLIAKALLTWL